MRRYVVIFFLCLSSIVTYSQNITNSFWGLTWKTDALNAFYTLKAKGLSPKICPMGYETIISIENVSYNNKGGRYAVCFFLVINFVMCNLSKTILNRKDRMKIIMI